MPAFAPPLAPFGARAPSDFNGPSSYRVGGLPIPAFPSTPVFDDFNTGASQNLTARTGWNAAVMRTGDATHATDSVPTLMTAATTASNVWDGIVSHDIEAYYTLGSTYTAGTDTAYLFARVTQQGSVTGYALQIGTVSNFMRLSRFVAGVGTQIGTATGITVAAGDSVGIQVVGNVIRAWYQPAGGAWTMVDQTVDNTIGGAGKIGILTGGHLTIDSMGGGIPVANAIVPATVTPSTSGVAFGASGSIAADTTIQTAAAGASFGASGSMTTPTSVTPANADATFGASGSITAPTAITPATAGVSFGASGSITGPARVSGTTGVTFTGSGSITAPTFIVAAASGLSFGASGSITAPTSIPMAAAGVAFGASGSVTAPTTVTFSSTGVSFGASGSITAPALIGQFPRVGSLDEFNTGASQSLTARTGWNASPLRTGDASLATDSVPTTAVASGTSGNLWDDPAVADSETWLTLAAYNPSTHQVYTCARVTVQGTLTAYALQIGFGSTFQLLKFVAGSPSLLGSSGAITCAPGDSVGIAVVGNQVSSYYRPVGGVWTLVATVTDSAITAAGKYGGFFCSSGVAIDRIGGGIYVVGSAESGVTFGASGTITASSTPFISGTDAVSFGASGTITAPTSITPATSAVAFGSSGSIIAPTTIVAATSGLTFGADGSITAPTFVTAASSGVSFSGALTLAQFIVPASSGASFGSSGTITAPTRIPFATSAVSFGANGSISAPTTITFAATGVSFGASGTITSNSAPFISGTSGVAFNATVSITAPTGIVSAASGVTFTGSGALTSPARPTFATSSASFGASGSMTTPTRITFTTGTVTFSASGTVTAPNPSGFVLTKPFDADTPTTASFDAYAPGHGPFGAGTPTHSAFDSSTPTRGSFDASDPVAV